MRNLLIACGLLLAATLGLALPISAQQLPMGVVPNCWTGTAWTPCQLNPSFNISPAPYPFTPLTPMQAGLAIVTSTALTLPTGATYAVVCARGQNANYTTDGTTAPTASVGMALLQNQCVSLQGASVLSTFRAIQQAATATLDVNYFK